MTGHAERPDGQGESDSVVPMGFPEHPKTLQNQSVFLIVLCFPHATTFLWKTLT